MRHYWRFCILSILLFGGWAFPATAQDFNSQFTIEINGYVNGLRWQADGSAFWWWTRRVETDYNDFELWRWEVSTGAPRPLLDYHVDQVELYLNWEAGEDRVLVWGGQTLEIWNALTGQEVFSFAAGDTVWGTDWNADYSQVLFWTLGGRTFVADLTTGTTQLLQETGSSLQAAVWQADGSVRLNEVQGDWDASGTRVLIVANDFIQLLTDTGEPLRTLRGGRGSYKPQWNPDRTRILALNEQETTAEVWDVLSGELLFLLPPPADIDIQIIGGAWSRDGQQVAVYGPWSMVTLWDVDSGTRLFALEDAHMLPPLVWSPDLSRLAYLNDDGRIRVVDAHTGVEQVQLFAEDIPIVNMVGQGRLLQWSADSAWMLVYGDSDAAWIWDTHSGQRLTTLHQADIAGMPATFYNVLWSADETRILTAAGPAYCEPINCLNQIQVWAAN